MGSETRDACPGEARRRRAVSARLWLAMAMVVAAGAVAYVSPARTGDTGARHDPWQAWLADERACPGAGSTTAPAGAQRQAMLCLVNYARTRQGLRPLTPSRILNSSAAAKAADIARCQDFRHDACGKRAGQTARALGYRGTWRENLYIGTGWLATPRAAVNAWLQSPGHRATLFQPRLRTSGIAVLARANGGSDGRLIRNGVIWVHQLGA